MIKIACGEDCDARSRNFGIDQLSPFQAIPILEQALALAYQHWMHRQHYLVEHVSIDCIAR